MFTALINFLVSALVIYLAGNAMRKVHVKSYGTALLVVLGVSILNFFVGWLLTFLLNVATLGIFYFTGLNFIISIIVNAVLIEIVDQFSSSFNTQGFSPSLWLAILLALANTLVYAIT